MLCGGIERRVFGYRGLPGSCLVTALRQSPSAVSPCITLRITVSHSFLLPPAAPPRRPAPPRPRVPLRTGFRACAPPHPATP